MHKRNKEVVCADGFKMSVQAHDMAYSIPRANDAEVYEQVEIGFPSQREELIMPWCENADEPTDTVYGYVPVDVVTNVIVKHGGIASGEVPPGVIAVPALEDKHP